MTDPGSVVVESGGDPVASGAVVSGTDPPGSLVSAVGLVDVGPDTTTEVVVLTVLVVGTDVGPSSADVQAATTIVTATAAVNLVAHRLVRIVIVSSPLQLIPARRRPAQQLDES